MNQTGFKLFFQENVKMHLIICIFIFSEICFVFHYFPYVKGYGFLSFSWLLNLLANLCITLVFHKP